MSFTVSAVRRFLVLVPLLLAVVQGAGAADVLTLPEGIRLATEQSRILKMAVRDELISEFQADLTRSRMLPSVNASLSGTLMNHEPEVIIGGRDVPVSQERFVAYGVTVQQLLFDFSGSVSRYEAGRALMKARKLDTGRLRNLVALSFIDDYISLLESEKVASVAEREVERLEAHLRDAEALFEGGITTRNDLLQAEVRIADARQRLLTARNTRAVAASRVNIAIGQPLGTAISVADPGESLPLLPLPGLDQAWGVAEKERPELRIADETLRSFELEQTARRSAYYPRFTLQGGFDYTENRYQRYEGIWSVVLGMSINLLEGGATRAELAIIEQRRARLEEDRRHLADQIRLEVERHVLGASTARERLAVASRVIRQAEENLRITRAKYEEGTGTATDVLDAVLLLTTAETNYYRATYDLRRAEAAVLYAVGRDITEVYR